MIKKITIISSYFAPAWSYGGPPKVLFTLAKELVKLGCQLDVITTDSLGEKRTDKMYEEIDKIKIFRFKNLSNTLAYKFNFFYVPEILSDAKKIFEKTDIVLFSDVRNVFNWQFYRYAKNKKIHYGVFAFGQIPHGFGAKALIKKLFDFLWVTDFIQNASFRFAQTEHERDMYQEYFDIPKDKIHLLPLPIERINTKTDQNEVGRFRKKWRIDRDDKVIIFVGRINYLKGIDILINSTKELLISDKKIKLLIVGRDDGYLSALLSLIPQELKDQIIFPGALYGEEAKIAYLCSSCFCITPRFYEETSLASLEALSYGVPVVASRQADIPYLEEYQAGYVVDNDSDSIKKAIMRILEKVKKDKAQAKKNTQKLISDKFSSPVVVQQILSIIDK